MTGALSHTRSRLFDPDLIPERLRHFDPADWPGRDLPAEWPAGWNAGKPNHEKATIWQCIGKRQQWTEARAQWMKTRGITPSDVLDARYRRDAGQLRDSDRELLIQLRYSLAPGVPFWTTADWRGSPEDVAARHQGAAE